MLTHVLESFRRSAKKSRLSPRRRRGRELRSYAALERLESRTLLSAVTFFQKYEGVDWTSAAVGGIGNAGGGQATLNVGSVTGRIGHAYLYWQGIDRGFGPSGSSDGIYDNETITFDGAVVTGTSLGMASAAISGTVPKSQAFRADVTALVRTGIQSYIVAGLTAKTGHDANGVSLVVVYQDGDASNDRDLYVLNGNHVNAGFNSDREWSATLNDFLYRQGDVRAQLHVVDGQSSPDATLRFSSSTGGQIEFEDDPTLFDGLSTPSMGTGRVSNGSLWDVHTFDISSIAAKGSQTISLQQLSGTQDSIGLILALFDTSSQKVNTPPVASDLNLSGFEDQPLGGQLPGFDADGNPLTYSIVTPPNGGLLTVNAKTGSFVYTSPADFYGAVTFTYKASDADSSSAASTVRLVFASVNDPPVVEVFGVSMDEDSIYVGRVMAWDVDHSSLYYKVVDGPKHGTLVLTEDGAFRYTPDPDWHGEDGFTVSVSDGEADPVLAVLPVYVNPVNDPPTLSNATLTVPAGVLNGAVIGTLDASDIDGDPLTYLIVSGNETGAFAIDPLTGAITIADVAALNRLGTREYLLNVAVMDPTGATANATLAIGFDAPTVSTVTFRVGFKSQSTINLKGSPWIALTIYSSDTFDVRDIDLRSLTFGRTGDESSIKAFRRPLYLFRDVDGDGKLDLLLLVDVRKTDLSVGDATVFLKGTLKNGNSFSATTPVTVTHGRELPRGKTSLGRKAQPSKKK